MPLLITSNAHVPQSCMVTWQDYSKTNKSCWFDKVVFYLLQVVFKHIMFKTHSTHQHKSEY